MTLEQYREFALPATQLLIEEIGAGDTPVILYTKASSHLLAAAAESGANCSERGLARGPRDGARTGRTAHRAARQRRSVRAARPGRRRARAAREAVEKTGGLGHILNLGHGILQQTPVENARAFVQAGQSAPVRPTSARWKGRARIAMSDSNLHLQLNRERFEISEEFLEKYNRPGPALHQLSHGAGLAG